METYFIKAVANLFMEIGMNSKQARETLQQAMEVHEEKMKDLVGKKYVVKDEALNAAKAMMVQAIMLDYIASELEEEQEDE